MTYTVITTTAGKPLAYSHGIFKSSDDYGEGYFGRADDYGERYFEPFDEPPAGQKTVSPDDYFADFLSAYRNHEEVMIVHTAPDGTPAESARAYITGYSTSWPDALKCEWALQERFKPHAANAPT